MEKALVIKLTVGVALLAAFALWTVAVCNLDVQAIGPNDSQVGFATLNKTFHEFTGVHMGLYVLTDWLGLVPFGFVFGFAILGLIQWCRRKKITVVDRSILVLGVFYIVVMGVYILFEYLTINYRPVLINGYLEKSYPSSTTMLVMCVMPTAALQFAERIKRQGFRRHVIYILYAFTAFMVVGRLISGVHWCTDIIGGALLSSGLVLLYEALK